MARRISTPTRTERVASIRERHRRSNRAGLWAPALDRAALHQAVSTWPPKDAASMTADRADATSATGAIKGVRSDPINRDGCSTGGARFPGPASHLSMGEPGPRRKPQSAASSNRTGSRIRPVTFRARQCGGQFFMSPDTHGREATASRPNFGSVSRPAQPLDGRNRQRRTFSRTAMAWRSLRSERSLTPAINRSSLRHSHAMQLLPPKVAQERLGHSAIGSTLDLYSHVTARMQEDAAARIEAAFPGAIRASGNPLARRPSTTANTPCY